MSSWIESSLEQAVIALTRSGDTEIAANLGRLLGEPDIRGLQLFKSPQIAELADEIYDCDSLELLYSILKELAAAFEVCHCTVHCVRERSTAYFGTKVLTTFPQAWATEYVNRRYTTIDPVVAKCRNGPCHFFWEEMVVADPMTKSFIKAAYSHGVGPSGVTCVEQAANGGIVAVTFSSTRDHATFRQVFTPKVSDFLDIVPVVIGVFSDLACDQNDAPFNPTDDQLKVLRALASGKSMAEIEAFHFSYGSFRTIEKSILKSFGAKTLAQAAALASNKGLLENLPYFEEDIYLGGVALSLHPAD